jgi:hypothetical protein
MVFVGHMTIYIDTLVDISINTAGERAEKQEAVMSKEISQVIPTQNHATI